MMKSSDEVSFAVQDSILKVEGEDLFHSTAPLTVCGTIQNNPTLPLSDANGTMNTCNIAQVTNVNYRQSEDR